MLEVGFGMYIILVFSAVAPAAAENITLASQGTSSYTIVISRDASLSEKYASKELQRYLRKISGAELPIVVDNGEALARMIVLGDGRVLRSLKVPVDFQNLGTDGFAIKTSGPNLVIAGGRARGTMYGVFTFLEEVLGCRYYTPYAISIPKKETVSVTRLDITQKPDFEYREVGFTAAGNPDWAAWNKVFIDKDKDRGGQAVFSPRWVHTFADILPAGKYFADHPEYYALVEGKRGGQMCLTNPDVLKIAKESVLRWIASSPKARIFSVSYNDSGEHCRCDTCKAVNEEEGSAAGTLIRFVNAVADEVAKKHPDKLIDTLAYQFNRKPPKITKPRPNVVVRFAAVHNCQHHPYEKCEKDAPSMDDLRGWARITNHLYIWHYCTNFNNYLFPMPDLEELSEDIPMYSRLGAKGLFAQGDYKSGGGPAGSGGFMDDLKAYLIAKLLWNSKADAHAITADFLNGYFGKAGKPIGEFLDLLYEKVRAENIHGGIYDNVDSARWYSPAFPEGKDRTLFLTPEVLAKSERLFDEAERLAESPEILARVKNARLSIEYVKIVRQSKAAAMSRNPAKKTRALQKLKAFAKTCQTNGIERFGDHVKVNDFFEPLARSLR